MEKRLIIISSEKGLTALRARILLVNSMICLLIGAAITIPLIGFVPRLELQAHLFGNLQDKALGVVQ